MRTPTIVNQPPVNLLLQCVGDDDQDANRLGDICKEIVHARFSSSYLARLHRGEVPTNKLDIITDSHILDLHLLAAQHGCTPSDVALQERCKPASTTLLPSKRLNFCPRCWVARVQGVKFSEDQTCMDCKGLAKLDNAEAAHRASIEKETVESCGEAKTRRDREREKKQLACEAAWQRELATWPPFVPRNPIDALQPKIVRDLTTLNGATPIKPFLGDYLAATSARTCTHHNLRSFNFSTGETIKKCLDCTAFDKQRITILKTGKLSESRVLRTQQRWEERLNAEGLPAEPPDNPIVLSHKQLRKDLEAIEHAQAATADNGKSDDRASRIRKEVKTNTEAQRNCEGCGVLFVPNHASRTHCYDENCRKRQYKRKKRSERNGDSTTQSTINRSTNHEQ